MEGEEYIQEYTGIVNLVIGDLILRRQSLFFTNNLKKIFPNNRMIIVRVTQL